MNKRATLKALEGSIKKWEKIIEEKGIDDGSDNCPLCKLFIDPISSETCDGCPVRFKTGKAGCHGSPYEKWARHIILRHVEYAKFRIYCKTCRNLAEKELKFLKSLLPKEE